MASCMSRIPSAIFFEVWAFVAGAVVSAMAKPLPITNARNADTSEARLIVEPFVVFRCGIVRLSVFAFLASFASRVPSASALFESLVERLQGVDRGANPETGTGGRTPRTFCALASSTVKGMRRFGTSTAGCSGER
jgi:hypothetical protein